MEDTEPAVGLAETQEPLAPAIGGEVLGASAGEPPVPEPAVDYKARLLEVQARAEAAERQLAKVQGDIRSQQIAQMKQAERDARWLAIERQQGLILEHLTGEVDSEALGPKVAALRQQQQQATQAEQKAQYEVIVRDTGDEIVRLAKEAGLDTSDPYKLIESPEMQTVKSYWNLATKYHDRDAFEHALNAAKLLADRKKLEAQGAQGARRKPNLDMDTGQPASAGTQNWRALMEAYNANPNDPTIAAQYMKERRRRDL